jgi:hypothetical protein
LGVAHPTSASCVALEDESLALAMCSAYFAAAAAAVADTSTSEIDHQSAQTAGDSEDSSSDKGSVADSIVCDFDEKSPDAAPVIRMSDVVFVLFLFVAVFCQHQNDFCPRCTQLLKRFVEYEVSPASINTADAASSEYSPELAAEV